MIALRRVERAEQQRLPAHRAGLGGGRVERVGVARSRRAATGRAPPCRPAARAGRAAPAAASRRAAARRPPAGPGGWRRRRSRRRGGSAVALIGSIGPAAVVGGVGGEAVPARVEHPAAQQQEADERGGGVRERSARPAPCGGPGPASSAASSGEARRWSGRARCANTTRPSSLAARDAVAAAHAEREPPVGRRVGDGGQRQRDEVRALGAERPARQRVQQPGRRACSRRRSRRTARAGRAASARRPPRAPPAARGPSWRAHLADRQRAGGERAAERARSRAGRSAAVRDDVDAAVRVVDPVDRHLVDAQAGPLGQHQQLGVEEPAAVLDQRQQLPRAVGADRLEPALGVGEAGAQRRAQEQVVASARSAPASCRARPASRAPGGCRSRRRCARSAAARPAAAARSGRSTGRRPCRRRRSRRSRSHTVRSARPRPFSVEVDGAHVRQPAGERRGDRPRRVGAGVVGDRDPERDRQRRRAVVVQPLDARGRGRPPRCRRGRRCRRRRPGDGRPAAVPRRARDGGGWRSRTAPEVVAEGLHPVDRAGLCRSVCGRRRAALRAALTTPAGANRIRTTAPPSGAFAALTPPPPASAACRTIASPRPGAGRAARVGRAVEAVEHVAAGRRRRSRARGRAPRARRARRGRSPRRPRGDHLRAFSSTFETARSTRSGSPRTTVSSRSRSNDDGVAGASLDAIADGVDDQVEADLVERLVRLRRRAPARRCRRSARSARRAPTRMSARSCSWSSSGSRSACSSVWMFVRRLEIGVRSSWLASSTRCRWASTELLERGQRAVEAARQPAELVVAAAPRSRCERSGSTITASVLRVKRAIGASAVPRHERAEHRRERHARRRQRRQHDQQPVERRRPSPSAAAPPGRRRRGRRRPSARAGGRRRRWRRVNARPVPDRASARSVAVDRQHGRLAGRTADRAVGSDDLERARRAAERDRRRLPAAEVVVAVLIAVVAAAAAARRVDEAARALDQGVVDLRLQLGPGADVRARREGDRRRRRRRLQRPRRSGRANVMALAGRSRRRGWCGSAVARRPPRACAAGSRRRRAGRSRRGRSRSPRRGRRSGVCGSTRRGFSISSSSSWYSVRVSSTKVSSTRTPWRPASSCSSANRSTSGSPSAPARRISARTRASSSPRSNGFGR